MQLRRSTESANWVIATLVLFAGGVGLIVYVAAPLPDIKLGGGFLLGIAILQLLLYKNTSRRFYAWTQLGPAHAARLWARSGERGTRLLFLGTGIILALAGCTLIILGSMR
jgi:hypothetical protein